MSLFRNEVDRQLSVALTAYFQNMGRQFPTEAVMSHMNVNRQFPGALGSYYGNVYGLPVEPFPTYPENVSRQRQADFSRSYTNGSHEQSKETTQNLEEDAESTSSESILEESGTSTQQRRESRPSKPKRKRSNDIKETEAHICVKALAESASTRDEYSTYGEHVANQLRNSGRSRLEIAIARHEIDNICFKLNMGAFSHNVQSNAHSSQETDVNDNNSTVELMSNNLSRSRSDLQPPSHTTVSAPEICASGYSETSNEQISDNIKDTTPPKSIKQCPVTSPHSDASLEDTETHVRTEN